MKPEYWRLRIRELARKVDEARALRCPEYVDADLLVIVNSLGKISERQDEFAAAASS
jgi:hypothetical protein